MNSTLGLSKSSIDRITRGLEVLDTGRTGKVLITRNISVRILIVTYIVYAFLFDNLITQSVLVSAGIVYFLTQAYVTARLIFKADYGISDWLFLFKEQSKLSKFFIIAGLGLVVLLSAQTIIQPTNIVETLGFIGLFLMFISTTLTDVLVQPFLKYQFRQAKPTPEQQVLDDRPESQVNNAKYHQIAVEILTDKSLKEHMRQNQRTQGQTVQPDMSSTQMSVDSSDTSIAQLRQQAIEKLEKMDGSKSNKLALTPEEIDELSEEELDALLYTEGDEPSTKQTTTYQWEETE